MPMAPMPSQWLQRVPRPQTLPPLQGIATQAQHHAIPHPALRAGRLLRMGHLVQVVNLVRVVHFQEYLTNKKTPTPLAPPYDPR